MSAGAKMITTEIKWKGNMMSNKQLFGLSLLCAFMMAGCMSYEGMKTRIEAGDSMAKEEIISEAQRTNNQTSEQQCKEIEKCLTLINDDEKLLDFINKGYGLLRFRKCAANLITFQEERLASKILLEYYPNVAKEGGYTRDLYDEILLSKAIAKETNPDVLIKAFKLHNNMTWKYGSADEIMTRIAELGNQEIIKKILLSQKTASLDGEYFGGISQESKKVLAAKLSSVEDLIVFADDYDIGEDVIARINERDAAKYLLKHEGVKNGSIDHMAHQQRAIEKLVAKISEEKLLAAIAIKNSKVRGFVLNKISNKKLKNKILDKLYVEWAEVGENESDGVAASILILAQDDDQIARLMENIKNRLCLRDWKDIVDRIKNAKTADLAYDNFAVYDNGLGSSDFLVEIMQSLASKMSKEKRAQVVSVIKGAQSDEGVMFFDGFQCGMKALDCCILSVETKISAIPYVQVRGQMREKMVSNGDILVDEIVFSMRDASKTLQCEDSEVLYYMIHRYVMNKPGKTYSYEYAKFTDVETEKTQHFSLMSGISQKYTTWHTYTNSKLGIKIWVDEKGGVVKVTRI